MEQSTHVSLRKIQKLLSINFDRILAETAVVVQQQSNDKSNSSANEKKMNQTYNEDSSQSEIGQSGGTPPALKDDHNNNINNKMIHKKRSEKPPQLFHTATKYHPGELSETSTRSQPTTVMGTILGDSIVNLSVNKTSSSTCPGTHRAKSSLSDHQNATYHSTVGSTSSSQNNCSTTGYAATSSTKESTHATSTTAGGGATGTGGSFTSIFDSTSDFIITGNELTGNIVNLSAFNIHLLTRPTVIHDKRYERNSLLFCVGFVLRRAEDPRPFRPLLSKLALALKRMELEAHFLSKHITRQQLQPLLDRILVSLNCQHWETNLVIHSNVLNLKLFHPPKYPATAVPDHAVPILLRRDWQVQLYDWDLAINWVVLHIDGVANARQISLKAEVDMEMVRNCLRVLKHHNIISVVDMFFYSNRYESTPRAASMLAEHESQLLQEAAEYVMKRPLAHQQHNNNGIISNNNNHIQVTAPTPYSTLMAPLSPSTGSPTLQERFLYPPTFTAAATGGGSPGSPINPALSYPPEVENNCTAATASSLLGSSLKFNATLTSYQPQDHHLLFGSLRREEQRQLKTALAELYCCFHRRLNFGDLWVELATGCKPRSQNLDRSVECRGNTMRDAARLSQQPQQYTQGNNGCRSNWTKTYTKPEVTELLGSEGTREHGDASPNDYYLERLKRKRGCNSINWGSIFESFDHRRFVSFGLVNGLLERVHNYPLLLYHGTSARPLRNGSNERSWPSIVHDVAKRMDGVHCDDHIVSLFQQPFQELIELVEKEPGAKVLSIYSTR